MKPTSVGCRVFGWKRSHSDSYNRHWHRRDTQPTQNSVESIAPAGSGQPETASWQQAACSGQHTASGTKPPNLCWFRHSQLLVSTKKQSRTPRTQLFLRQPGFLRWCGRDPQLSVRASQRVWLFGNSGHIRSISAGTSGEMSHKDLLSYCAYCVRCVFCVIHSAGSSQPAGGSGHPRMPARHHKLNSHRGHRDHRGRRVTLWTQSRTDSVPEIRTPSLVRPRKASENHGKFESPWTSPPHIRPLINRSHCMMTLNTRNPNAQSSRI